MKRFIHSPRFNILILFVLVVGSGCTLIGRPQARKVTPEEWPSYGRDPGGMRHSPLHQITRRNVSQLQIAWTYRTGEFDTSLGQQLKSKAAFEATPIMIDGTLYFSTPTDRVIALDAATGNQLWVHDPQIQANRNYSEVTSRGVACWIDPRPHRGNRIFLGTIDGRLIALHAATGKRVHEFGTDGMINLLDGLGAADPGQYQVTSPPSLIGNVLVVGSSIGDNRGVRLERGVVRGFDARTGRPLWIWDPIPRNPNDPGYDTWLGPSAHHTGAANAWAPLSVDPVRGLVFVPTSAPSPDYYGGERLGKNLHANCVVALRAATGELVWSFQTVHHDLWDYDVPMQPVLLEIKKDHRQIPAVVVGTKSGHLFVLHRETGQPVFPIVEQETPASDVPGESTWPTQPFPEKLPRFGLRQVTKNEAWGLTPEDLAYAKKRIELLRSDGPFTPPSLRGSIQAPSSVGGFHWGGLAFDPARGILVGPVNRLAAVITLIPRDSWQELQQSGQRLEGEISRMEGTPYVVHRDYLFRRGKTIRPLTAPPWGTLAAVNLQTGLLHWEQPLGFMFDPRLYPDASRWGSFNLGGAITTTTGLTFIAGSLDDHLRAFDTDSGSVLWEAKLPASAQATPMTYQVNKRQFVVICAGGHGKLGSTQGDFVVAFALPLSPTPERSPGRPSRGIP